MDTEAISTITTNLREVIHNDLSSDEGSMSGLQERVEEDSLSSGGSSIPPLQRRAKEDSSSDDDTKLYGEDGIYDDGEPWENKALSLSQIIGGNSDCLLFPSRPTLYAFSLHGYAEVHENCTVQPKPDFYQAKE